MSEVKHINKYQVLKEYDDIMFDKNVEFDSRSIILYNDCTKTYQLKLVNTADNKGARSSTVLLD
uniref:SFRICE_021227 n=1 Tax=Spodoptera frugiperda TaxID=7108 RepID=A0A2H1W4X4_SPOFR